MRYLKLASGAHKPGGNEGCLMEMVSYLAGEDWSDHPKCTSPVIAAYGRQLNDNLPDNLRPQLTRYSPRLIGTRATREIELKRVFLAADYAVRVFAPIGLRAVGHEADALRLESLEPITDERTAELVRNAAAASAAYASAAYASASAAYAAAASAASAAYASDAAAASAAYASDAAYAATWREILPLALRALDEMIALGPGGSIPDDWFEKAICVVPEYVLAT